MTVIDGNTLDGVSATTLWTLHNRASEARKPGGVIKDPRAVAVFDAIDYDYRKFGRPNQSHALRAAAFDAVAADYLRAHPRTCVVALAEGLQTSFWRLDAAGLCDEVTWYSVDLPPVIALRELLLPADPRIVTLAQSALDRSWMDRVVDTGAGVFITAEGLFMYLDPADVRALIADCAERFPGGQMMFDSIPQWLHRKTLKGFTLRGGYRTPPMPFGISADDAVALARQIPGIGSARDIPHLPGRGPFKLLASKPFNGVGALRNTRPSMTLLEFGPAPTKHAVDLAGVSETALMTLQVRATEARRPDGIITDPMAVSLVDSIDFDFAKFGPSRRQDMALRARSFDEYPRRYLRAHPRATVVALAEGLQTTFWRLDDGAVGHEFHWLSVDLPPVIDIRRQLLPASERITMLAQSALDYSWMDGVDPAPGVFITAEGLLMYLQPEESMALIRECAKRFPGGQLMFDVPPPWAAALTRKKIWGWRRYRIPPMPFSLNRSQARDLVHTVAGVTAVHLPALPDGRGKVMRTLIQGTRRSRRLRDLLPLTILLEFG